jgi:universal stress protein A
MANYRKILVAVDLTDHSEMVVRRAVDVAAAFDAEISLLHVVEYIPVEPMGEALLPAVDIEDELAVLGSKERHGVAVMLNLTEDTILHAAPCDVLAVRVAS